jgi:predicted alpha-1,2-mannosidase
VAEVAGPLSRRRLLGAAGLAALGAAGGPLLAGCDGDPGRAATVSGADVPDNTGEADPMVGTGSPGNTYPGAHLPFGFAAPSPDTDHPTSAGYSPTGRIVGFSQTHVSGTGGDSRYGNFRVTPVTGERRADRLAADRGAETASPGYYAVELTGPRVLAELTATRRVGLHRYTFHTARVGHLVLEASSVVADYAQTPVRSDLRIVGDQDLEGSVTVTGGWGDRGSSYTLYLAARLDRPVRDYATFVGDQLAGAGFREVRGGPNQRTGAVLTVDTSVLPVVELRLALSFVSVARARATLAAEVGEATFDQVRRAARAAWRDALATVRVDGGSAGQRAAFYSALYHCQLMPHDLTGENAWWRSSAAHYEDFYTLWDTSHALHPLLTLIQPKRQAAMVQSLIETYRHTGWLPDARIAGSNAYIQGGTNGDVLVADALAKGLPGIDYRAGYAALRRDGEQNSPDPRVVGRDLGNYLRLGYLPLDHSRPTDVHGDRSASRTLEYALQDHCIALVAEHYGQRDVAAGYRRRAANWTNLWDPGTQAIRPRYSDGRWFSPFDPAKTTSGHFYEGSGYQYAVYPRHDTQGIVARLGGDAGAVRWLDALFDTGRYDPGNEPDLHAPYLYLAAGRPDRAADRLRTLLAAYRATPTGLPGNDDAGALSAWYVWGALGLYPNAGQDWYYLGSPLFEQASVGGLRIVARGTSERNRHVRAAKLNGRQLDRAWLHHRELRGTLELEMGSTPSGWGQQQRPPSLTPRR